MMDDEVRALIQSLLNSPKSVEGDEGRVEMRSMSELIEALKYLRQQGQKPGDNLNALFKKIVPDGSID